jgi:hypothetical protein
MVDVTIDSLEETLVARLLISMPDPPVYGNRIYPLRMPAQAQELEFPLLVYKRISAPRIYTQQGDGSIVEPRVQYSIWSKSFRDLTKAGDDIKLRLSGYVNQAAGIQHCFLAFELDQWEEQTGLFRKMLDAQVGWKGN